MINQLIAFMLLKYFSIFDLIEACAEECLILRMLIAVHIGQQI